MHLLPPSQSDKRRYPSSSADCTKGKGLVFLRARSPHTVATSQASDEKRGSLMTSGIPLIGLFRLLAVECPKLVGLEIF